MSIISMKQLLEAGVHFGHQTKRWNPKMKKYIYVARNDIHIIDLQITAEHIEAAYKFVVETAKTGKPILFVGTKKQAQEAIKEEAIRCGQYYINSRWLGGTLTNYKTIRTRIDRLIKLTQMEKLGEFELLPKKEVAKLKSERDKLETNLGGIKEMKGMPGLLFVVDPKKEALAVAEAHSLKIPIVGIVDTNCDPDEVDYVIPGNDDAIRAVKLIASVIANAIIEANQGEQIVTFEDADNKDLSKEFDRLLAKETKTKEKTADIVKPVKAEKAAEAIDAPKKNIKAKSEKTAENVETTIAKETTKEAKAKVSKEAPLFESESSIKTKAKEAPLFEGSVDEKTEKKTAKKDTSKVAEEEKPKAVKVAKTAEKETTEKPKAVKAVASEKEPVKEPKAKNVKTKTE